CTNYNITHEQTAPSNACYLRLTITNEQDGNIDTFAVNYPATDTTYHAYNGTTVTIAFGQTVYGGVLDVTRGKLHVTHYGVEYDGTEDGWNWYGDYQQASIALSYPAKYDATAVSYMCNRLTPIANQSRPANVGNYSSLVSSGANSAFSTPETSLANFKTWLGSHHVQFVYELATPFDIDLTPVQIRALMGENNVYSDTNGNTTVKFKDSIQHYIDTKVGS
ncbi:MAG: hypothetical protein IIZ78_21215, partial [Clostridiales bacterium]|nr:hypothetical protein [Clostridiales bacterium]